MIIVVDYGLNVQEYVHVVRTEGIGALEIPDRKLECPFCEDRHRLTLNGSYSRQMVTENVSEWTKVRQGFCKNGKGSVSFLPPFVPRGKQHSWEVIGTYLWEREVNGRSEKTAMEAATKVNPSRQKGAYWSRCFRKKVVLIQAYVSSLWGRVDEPLYPRKLVRVLRQGFARGGEALARHNQRMHERIGVWLL